MSNINKLLAKPKSLCTFCKDSTRDDHQMGQLLSVSNDHNAYHYYCLLFSSGLIQRGNDEDGILGFLPEDINKEIIRGKKLRCAYCGKIGATIGCSNGKCRKSYHMSCGLKHFAQFSFLDEFRSWCKDHRMLQRVPAVSCMSQCQICFEESPADPKVALCAPCCHKDIWYHKKCLQDLAISSGYYFKCPMCNDKSSFVKTMQQFGIYVPEKDASWELEPNAYDDLLERPFHCEAAVCLCDIDRDYDKEDTPWEIQYCELCGSSGIHKKCLAWIGFNVWQCIDCVQHTTDISKRERLKCKEEKKNQEVADGVKEVECHIKEEEWDVKEEDVYMEEDLITAQDKESEDEENLMETNALNIIKLAQQEALPFINAFNTGNVAPKKNNISEADDMSEKSTISKKNLREKRCVREVLNMIKINTSNMKNHPEENEEQQLEEKDSDSTYSDRVSTHSTSKSAKKAKRKVVRRPCCLCSGLDLHTNIWRHIRRMHKDVLLKMTKGSPTKLTIALHFLSERGILLYNRRMAQNDVEPSSKDFLQIRKSQSQKSTPKKMCKHCKKFFSIVKFESHNCVHSFQKNQIIESFLEKQISSNILPPEICPEYYNECISYIFKDDVGMLIRNTKDILYLGQVLFNRTSHATPLNRRMRITQFLRRMGILYKFFTLNVVAGPSSFVDMFKVEHSDILRDYICFSTQISKSQVPLYKASVNTCCEILMNKFSLSSPTDMKEQISLFKKAWKKNFKTEVNSINKNRYSLKRNCQSKKTSASL